jgi:hypothetical protein
MRASSRLLIATPVVVIASLLGDSSFDGADAAPPPGFTPFLGPVDRAVCAGPNDRPETGIQGRTRDVVDVASGRAALGYTCNLEQLGHEGTVALWQMAWYADCAYYGVGSSSPNNGVAVVDARDPANPIRTTTLHSTSMQDPWESLKTVHKRGILAAVGPGSSSNLNFDAYDVTGDCASPVPLFIGQVNNRGHEGEWAPDGLTYYASGFGVAQITPIDMTNPTAPVKLPLINLQSHGLSFSDDGNRMYLAQNSNSNGLAVYDVSQIQARVPGAAARQVGSKLSWSDGSVAQMTIPVTIQGKPFMIFIDEGGLGMARIINMEDETNPYVVSYLRDEINMPDHATERTVDNHSGFAYQGHYCGVPRRDEPEVLACSYFWQGVRVFDIRDPYHPKEIAYFSAGKTSGRGTSSKIRFLKRKGRAELWFTDQNYGLFIAKFTGAWPFGSTTLEANGPTSLSEGGAPGNFTLALGQQPNGDTTVELTPSPGLAVFPSTLTFTRANYAAAQAFTVAPVDDAAAQGSRTATVTAKVISEGGLPPGSQDDTGVAYDLARDPHYMDDGGVSRQLSIDVADNDSPLGNFIERTNVALNTFITTETKTVCCYPGTLPISINGGQYSINGGPFTNIAGSIASGSTLALRHVSASTTNTPVMTGAQVGGYSSTFRSVTTSLDRAPDPFDFGTISNVEPSTLVQSGTQTLTGFNTGTPIVAGPGVSYSIDGGAFTSATGTLQPGQSLQVQQTSSASHLGYTKGYVKVGGVYGYFTTRTR